MAAFQIPPPERFNFSRPEEWPKWAQRFERYQYASGVSDKEESSQVHTLVYCTGDEADDILSSFGLSDADCKKYQTALSKFKGYFVKRKNVRARFNRRKQEEGEPVDNFIMDLYTITTYFITTITISESVQKCFRTSVMSTRSYSSCPFLCDLGYHISLHYLARGCQNPRKFCKGIPKK